MKSLSVKERLQLSRFFQGERPVDEPIALTHRRIFILPSHRGLGFVVLTCLLLLIAFVYNNSLAYLLGFLLASIFFITILHSFKALSGLIVYPGQSKPVFAGDLALFKIHIKTPTLNPKYPIQATLAQPIALNIPAESKQSVRLPIAASRRGWLECGTITLSSSYPLGLFRAWSPLRFKLRVLVYPKPSPRQISIPPSISDSSSEGSVKTGSDDFYGLKEYQKGDSIKHIHWKAYAKGQGLFRKQYSGSQGGELWLNYDSTPGQHTEERLSQLCRWILDAEGAGQHYGLVLPGLKIAPGIGPKHQNQCLEALALF